MATCMNETHADYLMQAVTCSCRKAPHEIVLQRLRNLEDELTDEYDTEPEGANAEALQVTDALDGFILDWCDRLGVPRIVERQ